MKLKNLFSILFVLALAVTGLNAQTDAILEGYGICGTDQSPNNVTDLQAQNGNDLCKWAFDRTNLNLYYWDDAQAAGSKWVLFMSGIQSVVEANGVVTVTAADGSTTQFNVLTGVTDGAGITTSTTNGNVTITNSLPEATTVTDGATVDLTETGDDITAEVKISATANNAVTANADGIFVDNSLGHAAVTANDGNTVDFTASGTDNQTLTAEVVLDPAAGNILTSSAAGLLGTIPTKQYFRTDALATAGGIGADQEYLLDSGNPYGLPRGTVRARQ